MPFASTAIAVGPSAAAAGQVPLREPTRPLRVLLAPSGFKECLLPRAVAEHMARGVALVLPDACILRAPIIDGGEGFTEDVVAAFGGTAMPVATTGPLGEAIVAPIGVLAGRRRGTVALSVASAAGLRLVPTGRRDPRRTTSRGVGVLIRAALDAGARRILVGCGDSGVNDGGAGLGQALGVRLLDRKGQEIGTGGSGLLGLASIDASGRDPRLSSTDIQAVVNPRISFLGPQGVSRIYGPQKGADPQAVEMLEAALANFAAIVRRDLGIDLATRPGAGASGGIAGGLVAFAGARLVPRRILIDRLSPLERFLKQADIVLTAEGCLDGQTILGKVPVEVARRAKRYGLPVIVIAGTIGPGAVAVLDHGVDAYLGILDRPCTMSDAMTDAPRLIADATAQAVRLALAGLEIARRRAAFY